MVCGLDTCGPLLFYKNVDFILMMNKLHSHTSEDLCLWIPEYDLNWETTFLVLTKKTYKFQTIQTNHHVSAKHAAFHYTWNTD